ncbi:exocyst subunit [Stygiomarasmius scandens]|uniref:Exocyst complex component Sec8 n=1 Tax=Marasmiellus scandens TaxID=2682957 RepID=A0ABR1K276_9AGAR
MSRAPPFPTTTRRGRSPSLSNSNVSISPPMQAPMPTRPLQINRPPSRPTTPSNSSISTSPRPINPSLNGPARPQRSELRNRASDYSGSESTYRDSVASNSFSDTSRSRNANSNSNTAFSSSRSKPARMGSSPRDAEETTPTSLTSVVSAFKAAGRRRATEDEVEYQRERRNDIEAEKSRQQRIREKAPGRRPNHKARAGDIDAILDQIKDEWEFVVDPDFNTVDLALQLLDDSPASGKDIESFRRTKHTLSKALKGSVDKHYQAFAASLPHHASLINHLTATQTQIDEARTSLQESKDALGSKRADLVQLWSRGQTLEEMMRLLDQIEQLKSVPDVLETLMSEKQLLQASVLLIRNLKIINKPDMLEIGAVSDLRAYLTSQEVALREILVDELHSHVYLKTFWCESRWAPYTPNQRSFPKVEFESETDLKLSVLPPSSPSSPSFHQTRLTRYLNNLTLRPNDPPVDVNGGNPRNSTLGIPMASSSGSQTTTNPESDSFSYIETVLESLAVLGKLGSALDIVAQRLSNEIYSLIDSTLDEVSDRAEFGRRNSMITPSFVVERSEGVYIIPSDPAAFLSGKPQLMSATSLRLAAMESSAQQVDHEIIKDFFWTLFSKMDAVAQSLRVVYEVANRIGSRRDFKDSSGTKPGALFSLTDIWISVQAEIKTLIYDYLTSEEEGNLTGRNPISSINEVLREGRFTRDRNKTIYRFADTDAKLVNKELRPHEDELTQVLKDTMPGLVQGQADNAVQSVLSSVGTDDRLLGAGQHHRLLIKPNPFLVNVLLQPTLAFLERVAEVLPSDMESIRALGTVLDNFVLQVYLPQLEEKVSLLFHQAVTGPDAFQPDVFSKKLTSEPLMKASIQLMALINSLCAMLQMTPFHRENYSRLILGVVIQFYQRCSDRFQDLVSHSTQDDSMTPHIALSAQWAQRSEITPCFTELLATSESDTERLDNLCSQETQLELECLGQDTVKKMDLVPLIRNLASLANLHQTIAWFTSELSSLKDRTDDIPPTPQNLEPLSAAPYTPQPLFQSLLSPTDQISLPLTKEMALRFQALLKTYEQLAELILVTIRIDVRCRALHFLDLAMRGNYSIDNEASEPDPHIIDLNNDLTEIDDLVSMYLPRKTRNFVFAGLSGLMEHILISSARCLQHPNKFGIRKIMRNILALQQCVKTIASSKQSKDFERAKRYFSLFFLSPQEMLEGIQKEQAFSFDEYQTMLALQCGVDPNSSDPRTSQATNRNYSMYVIELHGLDIEGS